MLFWVIIAACILFGSWFAYNDEKNDRYRTKPTKGDLAFSGAAGAVVGAIAGFFVAIVICWIVAECDKPESTRNAPDKPAKIISFQDYAHDQTDSYGTFILIAGGYSSHEDTVLSYRFYQEAPDGTFFLHNIEVDDNTKVHLRLTGPNVTPTAERKQPNEHWVTKGWIAPFDLNSDNTGEADETWIITVPRGTVVQKFQADGE